MIKVKEIFFLTKEEVDGLHKTDKFITHDMPHYTLENGDIMYAKIGGPALMERWYEGLKSKSTK